MPYGALLTDRMLRVRQALTTGRECGSPDNSSEALHTHTLASKAFSPTAGMSAAGSLCDHMIKWIPTAAFLCQT